MVEIQIPGWGDLQIKNLVLDFNGTIARDGVLIEHVEEKLMNLEKKGIKIYVITADTNKTVEKECENIPLEVLVFEQDNVALDKEQLIERLNPKYTVAIGNGRNDIKMLKKSCLSICVVGNEGAYVKTLLEADIVVNNIIDALDLLINANRIKATLRG